MISPNPRTPAVNQILAQTFQKWEESYVFKTRHNLKIIKAIKEQLLILLTNLKPLTADIGTDIELFLMTG